jgi:primosomal replication protein N
LVRIVTTKAGIQNDCGGSVNVAMTVCTVPVLVSGVCAEACQWCIKQWVKVAAVGMFASVASVRVRLVWRTLHHYIYACNGRRRAFEGRCS